MASDGSSVQKVLVVGSGGREHALAARLLESPTVAEVLVCPGNGGTHSAACEREGKRMRNVTGDPLKVARSEGVELAVVGPEAPLCAGLVDEMQRAGIAAFGTSRAASQLEGSKAFMKDFAKRQGIRTADYRVVRTMEEGKRALREFDSPPVVKADGLCAGKGVVVSESLAEAESAMAEMLSGRAFGSAGRVVVLEERLSGSEVSVHAICDGERSILLPMVQDHKRIGEGDQGLNTGGMGTYGPVPLVDAEFAVRIKREFVDSIVRGMAAEGMPYRGTLFAGLMIDESGEPTLLEINVRFGDPETQVLMNTIDGDLASSLRAAALGRLEETALRPAENRYAMCVVMAAAGYPGVPRMGDAIRGLSAVQSRPGVRVYHAGSKLEGEVLCTAGGRVLGVTGVGASLNEARGRAYDAVGAIEFDGAQFRRDVGARALGSAG